MPALLRKLIRDLGLLRGQVITIALVVACGIASFVALRGNYASLLGTRDRFYERQRARFVVCADPRMLGAA